MAQQVTSQLQAAGLAEEKAYFLGRYSVKGLQYGCLLATPLYALGSIRRGGFSLRGLMRANWVTPTIGAGVGSAAGYIQSNAADHPTISAKAGKLRLDADRVRSDDLHLIGSVLGALILPALFLRRVGLINGLLGGAGIGGAAGLITHQAQKYSKGNSDLSSDIRNAANKVENKVSDAANKAENKVSDAANRVEKELK